MKISVLKKSCLALLVFLNQLATKLYVQRSMNEIEIPDQSDDILFGQIITNHTNLKTSLKEG